MNPDLVQHFLHFSDQPASTDLSELSEGSLGGLTWLAGTELLPSADVASENSTNTNFTCRILIGEHCIAGVPACSILRTQVHKEQNNYGRLCAQSRETE